VQGWLRVLGPVGSLATLAGVAWQARGEEPPLAPPEPAFLEFLAEEAGVDEELSDVLMTASLDRAIEEADRHREGRQDDDG
jgi:hypothetical protein